MFERIKHLVSAELIYRKKQLFLWYGCLAAVALFIGLIDYKSSGRLFFLSLQVDYTLLLWMMIAGHALLTYKFITTFKHEHRLYFLMPLPLTRSEIGLSRLVYVVLVHGITFVIIAIWIFLILDPRQMHLGRIFPGIEIFEIKEIILWATLAMMFISLCISLTILLLESRQKRPLLSTIKWVILICVFVLGMLPFIGTHLSFISGRWVTNLVKLRGLSGARYPDLWSFMLIPSTPVLGLIAAALGTWYHRRITQMTSFRE